MKKIVCCLLIVWLVLLSGGVNAHEHAADHHSYEATHPHNHSDGEHAAINDISTLGDIVKIDAAPAETLSQAHSGHCHNHNHVTGLPLDSGTVAVANPPTPVPVSRHQWTSGPNTSNIDRPKWTVTTPTVVSLLS